jgi:hypothetical protein
VDANSGGERMGSRLDRLKQKADQPPTPSNAAAAVAAVSPSVTRHMLETLSS